MTLFFSGLFCLVAFFLPPPPPLFKGEEGGGGGGGGGGNWSFVLFFQPRLHADL